MLTKDAVRKLILCGVVMLLISCISLGVLDAREIPVGLSNDADSFGGIITQDPWWNVDAWLAAMDDLGADFVVTAIWYQPSISSRLNENVLRSLIKAGEEHEFGFMFNDGILYGTESYVDNSGWDWKDRGDGIVRSIFPPYLLEAASESPVFMGVVYDEPELGQSYHYSAWSQTASPPPFVDATDLTIEEAYEQMVQVLKEDVEYHAQYGAPIYTEQVLPIMFHNFARAGMHMAPKLLKESCGPIFMAAAIGAAKQYGVEVWASPDLWFWTDYPGHSAEKLKNTLVYAYWMGVDGIYVENMSWTGGNKGKSLVYPTNDAKGYALTDHGESFRWFTQEYLPGLRRGYTFRDIEPEIAIIRFPDGDWGQKGSGWIPDYLYGTEHLRSTPATRQWIEVFSVLTFNTMPRTSLTWNNPNAFAGRHHMVFYPLNNTVVYDHLVRKPLLEGLELVFLTGLKVSEGTLSDLEELVNDGLVVVSNPDLAPKSIRAQYNRGTRVFVQGDGKWVITDDFTSRHVMREIQPFIGKNNEIRYVIDGKELIMRPDGHNRNRIHVWFDGEQKF